MQKYCVAKKFEWDGVVTAKAASVMKMFGVDMDRLRENSPVHECSLELRVGDICYITGASGSGKSVLLREFYAQTAPEMRLWLDEIELEDEGSVIDGIEGDFFQALRLLGKAGLSDVFSVLNRPTQLSDGQKYRYRLAKALASGRKMIFADEFCSNLDRISAAVIAFNTHTFAKQNGVSFVLASSHEDLLSDLVPDVVVIKQLAGMAEVIYRDGRRRAES